MSIADLTRSGRRLSARSAVRRHWRPSARYISLPQNLRAAVRSGPCCRWCPHRHKRHHADHVGMPICQPRASATPRRPNGDLGITGCFDRPAAGITSSCSSTHEPILDCRRGK
jgi:hypothetical protein